MDELEAIRARKRAELETLLRERGPGAAAVADAASADAASADPGPVGVQDLDLAGLDALLARGGTAFVDLWAPWCGPCRAFAPVFEAVAHETPGAAFVKVNVDENPGVTARYQVQGIPTLLVVRDGTVVFRQAGALPRPMFKALVERFAS